MKIKYIVLPLLILSAISLFLGIQTLKKDAEIYDGVLRLHVLANSDNAEDQALKLKVRDAVLETTTILLKDCQSADHAEQILTASTAALTDCANEALIRAGSDQRASVSLTQEEYPTRTYASFRLPKGTYRSLKIEIGEGVGQNWWCVLFPSLCLSASATDAEDAFIDAGFSPDQIKVLTQTEEKPYVIRFRFLEWLGDLFS